MRIPSATTGPIVERSACSQDENACGPIPFDRRRIPRETVGSGGVRATAFELGGESFGRMHDLELIDHGAEGLGAFSETPISPGANISLGFDQPWMLARRGEVMWCAPCGRGYRVGVRIERRLAA